MEKEQFNVWVRPSIKAAAVKTVDGSDFTQGEVVEAAFAALFGTKDPLLRAKRQRIQQLAKQLKIGLNFKDPRFQHGEESMAA